MKNSNLHRDHELFEDIRQEVQLVLDDTHNIDFDDLQRDNNYREVNIECIDTLGLEASENMLIT